MLPFRPIVIEDKPAAEEIFRQEPARVTERCFADLFLWRRRYRTQIAFQDGFLYVLSLAGDGKNLYYLFPPGKGDRLAALDQIAQDAAERGASYRIYGCTPAQKEQVETLAPGRYRFTEDRDNFDYIYRREDLAELKGKKYHAKRNFINRFLQEHEGQWRYEPLDPNRHGDSILALHRLWCQRRPDGAGAAEGCAVRQALEYFEALEMRGGVLYLRGEATAFSMGCLAGDTLTVQIEKATADIPGAYPMINREFIVHAGTDFDYVNREEDMGIEGLRKAKLSYRPTELSVKYLLEPLL